MTRRTDPVRKRLVATLMPALRPLPPRLAGRILAAIGGSELYWNVPHRILLHGLIHRTAESLGCDWHVRRVAANVAANSLRWHARDLLLERLDESALDRMIEIDGRENLDESLAMGRGV